MSSWKAEHFPHFPHRLQVWCSLLVQPTSNPSSVKGNAKHNDWSGVAHFQQNIFHFIHYSKKSWLVWAVIIFRCCTMKNTVCTTHTHMQKHIHMKKCWILNTWKLKESTSVSRSRITVVIQAVFFKVNFQCMICIIFSLVVCKSTSAYTNFIMCSFQSLCQHWTLVLYIYIYI